MNAIAFQIINRLAEILREPDRYAKASGQRTFGFKSEGGHGGQKSFKWREELHPRDADGKFATEENKGQKADEPGNQSKDDETEAEPAFDPMQAVKVSANSIDKLRKQDVYRVIEWTPEKHRDAVAEFITKERPDLAEEVSDVVSELKGEDPQKFSRANLMESIRFALMGGVEKYREAKEDGHWVTINGNHVFIQDSNAGDHAKSMGKLHRVKAEHVQHLMSEAHQFLKSQIDQREAAKAHARRLSRLNAGSIGKIENSYRDWSSVDGFDSIARDVALAHPELGFDPDDTDTPGKVWDLIREGKEEYPAADSKEVAELAAKWLRSSTTKKKEVYPEDSLPFSRQARGDEADKYAFREEDHPRDNLGQFTAKHQEAIRKARDTASQKRSAADAAAKAREAAEQKWRYTEDDDDDSGLNAAYDAHEIASEEAENAQSAAEEAEQQARDELEGISDEVRAEIDSAKDEADELSEEHARVSKDIERLAKVAESKRTRAIKLRERASRKQQVAEEARKKEDDARWGGSGSVEFWERYSGRYKAAEAIVEAAESEDATEEQEAAAEKAQQVIDKIDEMHEAALDKLTDKWLAADEAYENAAEDAAVAEDEADEAESEVRQAQQELQEIASKWEAAKATAADLERRRLEIDNFRKSIGPALQGLFSPGVQKYSADKGEDRWITIGGSEDGNRKHAGGTPVKIDKEGKIVAGPDALAGKNVDELGGKNKTNEPTADKERLMSQEEEEEVKLQPKNTNKRDVPYQNPHTKKWHILNKKTGDKSDQGFETPGECQEAIDAPEFRPKKIGDRVYVVDRYGDKHWRWPDKSYDSIGQCQAEIDKKIEDDAESARKSSESRRKTQSSVPTFGPNGTHTILDNGPEK